MKESLSNPLKCVKARSEDLNIIFAVEPTTGLSDLFFTCMAVRTCGILLWITLTLGYEYVMVEYIYR